MKKLISLLVALALILSLSVTAFGVTGGFQDDPVVIETLEGGFEMTAGNNWNDSDVYFKYVAEKAGTIMTDAASGVWFSIGDAYNFDWSSVGETSINVVAGDVLYVNFCNTTPSTITANLFYEGDEPTGGNPGGDAGEVVPNGGALALGNNNVTLNYATVPMMAAKWTYTATETGFLTVTVASVNGNTNLGTPFGRGMYAVYAGESDGMGTNTVTVFANAGDVINIAVTDSMDMDPVPAVLNLTFEAGTPVVERDPADYFQTAPNGDYLLESLTEAVEIFVGGNDDIYFTYTAEADGTLALSATVDGYAGTNCAIKVNSGSWAYNAYSAEVSAGDTVRINIWQGFEGTAILLSDGGNAGGGEPGGNEPTGLPSGSALALGNNNVSITYAMMPMQAPYWTYTATEGGYLTVTVASIDGNSMLDMPFGRGMYTLVVGETDGQYTNTATVYLNAGDSVNIAVLDTVDDMGVYVPAVINLAFAAGEPVVERDPADFFEQDPDGNYIIESLANPVEIFVGNDDINYIYTVEEDGVLSVEFSDPTNNSIWYYVNDDCLFGIAPDSVSAGDIVKLNIWGDFAGIVTLTAGSGNTGNESAPMSGEDVAVGADESLVIYYTPTEDGVLSIDISANPGHYVLVQNADTLDTIGLPSQSSQAEVLPFDLEAGVEYVITLTGFSTTTWDVAEATITYEVSFEGGNAGGNVVDLDQSDVELVIGEQNVALLPNAITTLYNFVATEAGVYTVTIPNDAIAELYSVAWTSYQICEGNTLVFTATADGQEFLIGLTSEADSMNVKIEKTGDYIAPQEVIYQNYEGTCEIEDDFEMPEGEFISIDITDKHTIVLGDDGYYHLNSFDGPVILVNLNSDGFTLGALFGAGAPTTMRGDKFEGEDGELYCYDYLPFISGEYYSYSQEKDYHPLNADLMQFFVDYGTAQGWYKQGLSDFEAINAGEFEAESAWMVAMGYVEGFNGSATSGTVIGGNAQTGDFGVVAAAIAMGVSAICGTAVIVKKKEN